MKMTNNDIVRYSSVGMILLSFAIELNMLSFTDRTRILSLLYGLFLVMYIFIFAGFRLRFPKLMRWLIFFLAYLAFLAFFSSNRVISYNYLAKFSFGLLYFVIGYNFFFRAENLRFIAKASLAILTIGVLITFYNNFSQTGISLYENDFYGQSLATTYNTFALLVCVILTLSFFYTRREIIVSVVLIVLTLILLFLVFKRSPLIIIGLAGISTLLFSAGLLKVDHKMRRNIMLLVLVLVFTYPLYRPILENNIVVRQAAFEAKIDEQPRYKENIAVLERTIQDPVSLLFGTGDVFNSRGQVIYRDRMLHTDYANILWSGGMIGFIIYFGLFISLLAAFIKVKIKAAGRNNILNNVSFFGIIMVQSYFACALSQAWTSISVMSVIMLSCGAAYGFIRRSTPRRRVYRMPASEARGSRRWGKKAGGVA